MVKRLYLAVMKVAYMIKGRLEKISDLHPEDLMNGEEILYTNYRNWYSQFFAFVFSGILIILSVGIFIYSLFSHHEKVISFIVNAFATIFFFSSIFLSVSSVVQHYALRYYVTSYRVIKRVGVLSKRIEYVPYSKIQNVKVTKTIGESMVDMGDVSLDVAGSDAVEMVMEDVPDPERIHQIILEKMHECDHGDGL